MILYPSLSILLLCLSDHHDVTISQRSWWLSQKNSLRFSLKRRRRRWACADFNSYYKSQRRASSSDTLKSPMSTLTPSKSARILATGLPRSSVVAKYKSIMRLMSSWSSTGMMATVVRLPGRSSRRVLCISLYTFVLNRFPCSIILGMLLRTHDFNSSQFATRHPAEGVGFLSLALGGDGGGLGLAQEGG